jgi:hypothetical protein
MKTVINFLKWFFCLNQNPLEVPHDQVNYEPYKEDIKPKQVRKKTAKKKPKPMAVYKKPRKAARKAA